MLCLLTGCASGQFHLDQALLASKGASRPGPVETNHYAIGCPDVLQWTVDGRPELDALQVVGPDGRIDLSQIGRLRVEGRTVPEVTRAVAEVSDVPPRTVHVQVAEYNSQQIYLFGQVLGRQRSLPYHGPETVLQALQRAGGITPGAEPRDVYVVRARVPEGSQPEVFHINLQAIVMGQDMSTNIQLQPFDRIYVGETRKSCLLKCIHPLLRPVYEAICGLRRKPAKSEAQVPSAGGRVQTDEVREMSGE